MYVKSCEKILQVDLKPIDKERLQNMEYLVENNLPIEKQMLYEFMPDYFETDINDLELLKQEEIRKNQMKFQIVSL